ncbi:MAG TPA: hypothetical protein VHC69_19880 [Polyangiaceae bacterium]|nr:hypothetical protein [Polyangiaceae bacterium]
MPTKPRRRGPSRVVIAATAVSVLLGGGAIAALFVAGPLMRGQIIDRARALGVEMTFDGMNFWWFNASLEGVRFKLIGVPGIDGQARTIDVSLADFEPRSIEATETHVDVVGSAADLALAVGEWTKNHPGAYKVPVSAHSLTVTWRPSAEEKPWLTTTDGAMSASATGATFSTNHAVVAGVDIGNVGAAWIGEAATVTMGFGATDAASAPLRATVQNMVTTPTLTVTLAPTVLAKLAGPMGVPLPAPGAVASGEATLSFARGIEQGPVTGKLDARLTGWVPPHPVELDGFLFGKTTTFSTAFAVTADRKTVTLTQSRVKASAFDLSGDGRIDRHDTYATITMNLAGALPCAAVAQSAAAAHVGSYLAEILGDATKRVVDGSLSVRVQVSADSRHLDEARVEPTVGVGCGLSPIKTLDHTVFQHLPERIQDLASSFSVMPGFVPK